MPTIELNRKTVDKLVGKRLVDKDMSYRVSMFGTPVEELTKDMLHIVFVIIQVWIVYAYVNIQPIHCRSVNMNPIILSNIQPFVIG